MRGEPEGAHCEARKRASITFAGFSCRFVFLLVSPLLFVRVRETGGASTSEAKWHGPLLVRKAPSSTGTSTLRDSPVLRGSVSEQPWLCRGAEQFVQTYCGPCVADSQCAPGAFCCPYLKVCVSSETDRCSKPFARCDPPLPASKPEDVDFDAWRKQCPFAELETWVTCPPPGWVLGDDLTR